MFRHKQEHKNKLMITELGFVSNWKMLNMDLTGGIGQFMNQKYAKQRILCHYYLNTNTFPPNSFLKGDSMYRLSLFPTPYRKMKGEGRLQKVTLRWGGENVCNSDSDCGEKYMKNA